MKTYGENDPATLAKLKIIQKGFEKSSTIFQALNFLISQNPATAAQVLADTQAHIANKLVFCMKTALKNDRYFNLELFGIIANSTSALAYSQILDRIVAIEEPVISVFYGEIGLHTDLDWHNHAQN